MVIHQSNKEWEDWKPGTVKEVWGICRAKAELKWHFSEAWKNDGGSNKEAWEGDMTSGKDMMLRDVDRMTVMTRDSHENDATVESPE